MRAWRRGRCNALLLVVPDTQATWSSLGGKGGEITKPELQPWGAVHADFSDPDGNRWTLQQPRPRS